MHLDCLHCWVSHIIHLHLRIHALLRSALFMVASREHAIRPRKSKYHDASVRIPQEVQHDLTAILRCTEWSGLRLVSC